MEDKLIEIKNENFEKVILIVLIGILDSLKNHVISIEEAERIIFSPYMENRLRRHNVRSEIIDIIICGCELEDIESLLPEELDKNINDLLNRTIVLLKQYEKIDDNFWIR